MYNYLEDILAEAPDDFDNEDVTPTVSDLFCVNEACRKLDITALDLFYCIAARFLCVTKRERPGLKVVVSFLCKRVKSPNVDDLKKLGRLVRYVRATIHLPLIIGPDGLRNMVWIIDASFAVHMNMESHKESCLTLGTGSHISGSSGQRVNIRSSLEFELVGFDDIIGYVEWTILYCNGQVKEYPVTHPLKELRRRT